MTNNMIENQSIKDEVNPIYDKSLLDNFDFDDEIDEEEIYEENK